VPPPDRGLLARGDRLEATSLRHAWTQIDHSLRAYAARTSGSRTPQSGGSSGTAGLVTELDGLPECPVHPVA
jgi:hypothetical protein